MIFLGQLPRNCSAQCMLSWLTVNIGYRVVYQFVGYSKGATIVSVKKALIFFLKVFPQFTFPCFNLLSAPVEVTHANKLKDGIGSVARYPHLFDDCILSFSQQKLPLLFYCELPGKRTLLQLVLSMFQLVEFSYEYERQRSFTVLKT